MNWRRLLADYLGINRKKYGGPFPQVRINETIEYLGVGDGAYVLGWDVVADKNRNLWIEPDTPIEGRPDGTVDLFIVRYEDGLHVAPPSKFHWGPSSNIGPQGVFSVPVVNDKASSPLTR